MNFKKHIAFLSILAVLLCSGLAACADEQKDPFFMGDEPYINKEPVWEIGSLRGLTEEEKNRVPVMKNRAIYDRIISAGPQGDYLVYAEFAEGSDNRVMEEFTGREAFFFGHLKSWWLRSLIDANPELEDLRYRSAIDIRVLEIEQIIGFKNNKDALEVTLPPPKWGPVSTEFEIIVTAKNVLPRVLIESRLEVDLPGCGVFFATGKGPYYNRTVREEYEAGQSRTHAFKLIRYRAGPRAVHGNPDFELIIRFTGYGKEDDPAGPRSYPLYSLKTYRFHDDGWLPEGKAEKGTKGTVPQKGEVPEGGTAKK